MVDDKAPLSDEVLETLPTGQKLLWSRSTRLRRLRIEGVCWLFSAAIHATLWFTLARWLVALVDESPSLAGQRSVASIQLLASAAAVAGDMTFANELQPPEIELSMPEVEVGELPPVELDWVAKVSASTGDVPMHHDKAPAATSPPPSSLEQLAPSEESTPLAELPPAADIAAAPRAEGNAPVNSAAAAPSAAAMSIGIDDTTPAAPMHNPLPLYPPPAAARGIEGRVLLRILIGTDGRVTSIEVVASTGNVDLDKAAVDAVQQWRFAPARRAGQPVAWTTLLPVRFRAR